jgi:hypothetical protein
LHKSLVLSHCTRQGSNLQPCDPKSKGSLVSDRDDSPS